VEVLELKQMKSSRSKEAKAERRRKFLKSLNEMSSKTHADVGKRWDEKIGSIVNLQGRLPAKTYRKDTDSVSSGSKRKQKKNPSQELSLVVPREEEFVDTTDAMNSTAMSLSDDQDSLHTARSIRDNVQSSFSNEAYGEEEG
jgi:hypothetical protein